MTLTATPVQIRTFAEAEARLAETLPGYESRPEQAAAARFVEAQIGKGQNALLQAGTGCGKSLATLIPAILSGKRVVYSTATKSLQDQVAGKDLPFLQENLGVDFSFAILKGRSNYFCRAASMSAAPGDVTELATFLAEADAEHDETEEIFLGTRDQFSVEVTDAQWSKLSSTADACPGKKACAYGETCFSEKAKALARAADVVVVNHALLLTDLVVKEVTDGESSMLEAYDVAIIDEVHELEHYASSIFGAAFSEAGVKKLAAEVNNFAKRYDQDFDAELIEVNASMAALWEVLEPGRIRQADLLEWEEEYVGFALALQGIASKLSKLKMSNDAFAGESAKASWQRLIRRTNSMMRRFNLLITDSFTDTVRFVEEETRNFRGRNETVKLLKSAPVDVSIYLRPFLFAQAGVTVIGASATLAVAGRFDFIAKRLGVDDYSSLDAGSPFNYATQARMFVPDIPAPAGKTRQVWESMSIEVTRDLVLAAGGRALLLFTSRKQMTTAYDSLADRLPFNTMMQGQKPNKALAAEFMADETSVLFGVSSFMTGVDFQGATCSLVVIDKLMFAVPDDPLVEARCDAIKARGGNDFMEFVVPTMSLTLQQAAGRLIRSKTDTGVVALLDSRVTSKAYGKTVLRSLPPAPLVRSMAAVEDFFAEVG